MLRYGLIAAAWLPHVDNDDTIWQRSISPLVLAVFTLDQISHEIFCFVRSTNVACEPFCGGDSSETWSFNGSNVFIM